MVSHYPVVVGGDDLRGSTSGRSREKCHYHRDYE